MADPWLGPDPHLHSLSVLSLLVKVVTVSFHSFKRTPWIRYSRFDKIISIRLVTRERMQYPFTANFWFYVNIRKVGKCTNHEWRADGGLPLRQRPTDRANGRHTWGRASLHYVHRPSSQAASLCSVEEAFSNDDDYEGSNSGGNRSATYMSVCTCIYGTVRQAPGKLNDPLFFTILYYCVFPEKGSSGLSTRL